MPRSNALLCGLVTTLLAIAPPPSGAEMHAPTTNAPPPPVAVDAPRRPEAPRLLSVEIVPDPPAGRDAPGTVPVAADPAATSAKTAAPAVH